MKTKDLNNITGLSDTMFKAIMFSEKDVLIEVLNISLGEEIKDIKYLNSEMSMQKFLEKGKRLDLYLENENSYIDIEVTNNYNVMIVNRNIGFLSKMYTETINKGDDYTDYKSVKIINIIGNKRGENIKETYQLKNKEGKLLTEILTYSEIYIQNVVDLWYNEDVELINKYKYLIMLGLNKQELNKFNLKYGDEIVNRYTKDFNKVLEIEELEPLFDKEEDERRIKNTIKKVSFEEGIEIGKNEGKKEQNIEVAKKLLKNNVDIEIISKSTGLRIDEINKLNKV